MTIRPLIFDRDVLALYKPVFIQALLERGDKIRVTRSRLGVQEADERHRPLLRADSERPSYGRTGNGFNEIALSHCLPQGWHHASRIRLLQQGFTTSGMGFRGLTCAAAIRSHSCSVCARSGHQFGLEG